MGGTAYTPKDWDTFKTSHGYDKASTTTDHIYSSRIINPDFDPKNFKFRESRDSLDSPKSTPVILGMDVTGSMKPVLDKLAREAMNTLCSEIFKRKPITDPHICTLAIGDVEYDTCPIQATQFETDIRIFEQLEKLFLEEGGGGNNHESYILAWYFAKYRTQTDSFAKRGVKGFIITFGDEECTPRLSDSAIHEFMGDAQSKSFSAKELFEAVTNEWHVFHVILKEGDHARFSFNEVKASWDAAIGKQNVLVLDDYTKLGETIVSLLEVSSGRNIRDVTASWSGDTSVVVGRALKDVTAGDGSKVSASLSLDEAV